MTRTVRTAAVTLLAATGLVLGAGAASADEPLYGPEWQSGVEYGPEWQSGVEYGPEWTSPNYGTADLVDALFGGLFGR